MSEVLYAKLTKERKKEFQISTKIILQNGKKTVVKEALFEESKTHIEHMSKYYNIYSDNDLKPVECTMDNEKIYFSYVEGTTLNDLFLCEVKQNNKERAYEILNKYKKAIYQLGLNKKPFETSEEFESVFGHVDGLTDVMAGQFVNIDNIFENILLENGQYKIIDYEWYFDFYIPFHFVIYRAILDLYINYNHIFTKMFDFKKLLEELGLSEDEITIYHSMNEKFNSYVFGNYGYNQVKQQYSKAVLPISKFTYNPSVFAQLYYDDGNGFTEEKSIIKNIALMEYCELNLCKLSWDCSDKDNITRLRFDPINCEGYYQIVNMKAYDKDNKEISIIVLDENEKELELQGQQVSFIDEPKLFIQFDSCNLSRFTVEMRIYPFVDTDMRSQFQHCISNYTEKLKYNEMKLQKYTNYAERLKYNNMELQRYINSIAENGKC